TFPVICNMQTMGSYIGKIAPALSWSNLILCIIKSFTTPINVINIVNFIDSGSKDIKKYATQSRDYNKKHNKNLVEIFDDIHKVLNSNDKEEIDKYIASNLCVK